LAQAQYNLAVYYDNGDGVEKNLKQAAEWYRKAAEQGFAQAQNNLGVCYHNGEGIEQNMDEAVKWYKKAAAQGFAQAQRNLDICGKNKEEAGMISEKSADEGSEPVKSEKAVELSCKTMDKETNPAKEVLKWILKDAEDKDMVAAK